MASGNPLRNWVRKGRSRLESRRSRGQEPLIQGLPQTCSSHGRSSVKDQKPSSASGRLGMALPAPAGTWEGTCLLPPPTRDFSSLCLCVLVQAPLSSRSGAGGLTLACVLFPPWVLSWPAEGQPRSGTGLLSARGLAGSVPPGVPGSIWLPRDDATLATVASGEMGPTTEPSRAVVVSSGLAGQGPALMPSLLLYIPGQAGLLGHCFPALHPSGGLLGNFSGSA